MTYDSNNIFAKILRKEIPCQVVFEDDKVLAFQDIAQKRKVHVLVIPKSEYVSFQDFVEKAPKEDIAHFFQKVGQISKQLGVVAQGYRLIANHSLWGGQEVPHFHVHILGGEAVGPMVS